MALYKGTRRIKKLPRNGSTATLLVHRGRQVWPCRLALALPPLAVRMAEDAAGLWLEVGFCSPEELTGTAATGWTDPRGYCVLDLQQSTTLLSWASGQFEDCAASPEDMGDGTWQYWARARVPQYWKSVMLDLTATSDRYGKSVTAIAVNGGSVSLPNFPYALPGQAAALQADLRSAGYAGATVTTTSGPLLATARNHHVTGAFLLTLTQAAGAVTSVAFHGAAIALPAYPYALPGQAAALQADLRSAGYAGAVVMLHAATWQLALPDVAATAQARQLALTIAPGDPFPYWDGFGVYQGLSPASLVAGTADNVRTPGGEPLEEAGRQFARLRLTRGARVLP